jgi:hypothetical protein
MESSEEGFPSFRPLGFDSSEQTIRAQHILCGLYFSLDCSWLAIDVSRHSLGGLPYGHSTVRRAHETFQNWLIVPH